MSYDSISEARQRMQQARTAAKQGNREQAYKLLQQVVQLTPDDYMAWLWLASMTPDLTEAAGAVAKAEQIAPDDPRVAEARDWLARKQVNAISATPPRRTERTKLPTAVWLGGIALVLVCLVVAIGAVAWSGMQGGTETAVSDSSVPNNRVILEENGIVANDAPSPPKTEVTPTPSNTPKPFVPAKQVSHQQDQPRATWTVTPTPSPTPTPTPTWMPTWQSPTGKEYSTRPFGVGANEKWIDVDLSSQSLVAYEGNEPVFSTLVSSGMADHPTVTGQFRIWLAFESQTMDGSLLGYDYYLENVPYVMYFFEDYALHGAFWHNNFGQPMSHGCVNLSPSDAGWIFNWASVGTLVNVHD